MSLRCIAGVAVKTMSALTADPSAVVTLVDKRLYALPLPLRLGGRLSMFPHGAHGYSAVNCYLLVEGSDRLLVDTGFPAQREVLLALLGNLLQPRDELSVMSLRPGEPNSYGNLLPVARKYRVAKYYSMLPHQLLWAFDVGVGTDGGPELVAAGTSISELLPLRGAARSLPFGGSRQLEWFRPLLHMILQTWLFDTGTGTLFTSEVFGHSSREAVTGPWVIRDPDEDAITPAGLADFLQATDRFWWLPGAETARLADWVSEVFERFEVERIAPGFGCVIEGSEMVARAVGTLVEALAVLGQRPNSYAHGGAA